MTYENFCKIYKKIIDIACKKLKNNRFACFVVGEVRDKKGRYRNFVDYTKQCFIDNGLCFYNDIILLESGGTVALRARRVFTGLRKVVKQHQNILVFYKGDIKKIKTEFEQVDLKYIEQDIDE